MKQKQVRIILHHNFQESARLTCTQNIWNLLKKMECTKKLLKMKRKDRVLEPESCSVSTGRDF